jgi:hypothetical protein
MIREDFVRIVLVSQWGSRTPRTQIVAIGAHGTMFGDELREQFDRWLADPLQAAPAAVRRRAGRIAHEADFQTLQST